MSARLQERRAESQTRATLTSIEASGLAPDAYFAAIGAAYLTWTVSLPWRLLPKAVGAVAFDHFGGKLAGKFIAEWKNA